MAILTNGPNGGFSGKAGSVVGFSKYGKDFIRGLPKLSKKNKKGSPKQKVSDHFFVIVGMGMDANGKYFQFYDNAFGTALEGADRHNKVYYDSVTGLISGRPVDGFLAPSSHDYIITQVRKSKPKP